MYIHAYTYDRRCVEHGVDSGFGMIAHDKSAKLQVRAEEAAGRIIPQFNFAVIVFEIGGYSSGAQVTPFANNGIS